MVLVCQGWNHANYTELVSLLAFDLKTQAASVYYRLGVGLRRTPNLHIATVSTRGKYSSMVTKKFPPDVFSKPENCLFPAFGKLEASLIRFLAPSSSLALAKWRAFWADLKPFFDTCRLIICRNYWESGQEDMALSPDYDQVLSRFCRWRLAGPCQLRALS